MGDKSQKKQILTAEQRLSKEYYTFQDVTAKVQECKKSCKKERFGFAAGIFFAILALAANLAFVLFFPDIDDKIGYMAIPLIPVEILYIAAAISNHKCKEYLGPGFWGNIPVLIVSSFFGVGLPTFAHWNWRGSVSIFIVVAGLILYKTALTISICYDGVQYYSKYKRILKELKKKRGTLTCEEYDDRVFQAIAEYNDSVTAYNDLVYAQNCYDKAVAESGQEQLADMKLAAQHGHTAAQTFVREYDEFLRLATAENIDYAGLLAYCADKTLQSAMQDYLRNCEIKEHCGVKELETLKGLGNSQAETMLKLYAEKEYEAYKAKNTVDLVSLKVLADYGCADACAEYALRRYEDVTNGVYTKTEQEEMKKEIFDFFINGKSSANEIYKTSCFIMSLELKYQLGRYNGSYDSRLEEYKGDLSALREIKLGAEYKDVFGLDFENIVKELIEYIIKKIDEKEHPTPAAINYLDTGESISKRAQEIYNKMIGVSDDTSSKSNDDSLEYFAWKHMMDQSNTPWD